MPKKPRIERIYTPCASCGSRDVKRTVTMAREDNKELVLVDCAFCGNRRGKYKRTRKGTK